MELIQGKQLSDMIEYFKQNFRQDPNGVAAVGTLCHPIISKFYQVFVNTRDSVNCTLMIVRVPLIEDLLSVYSQRITSQSLTMPDETSPNEHMQHHATQFHRFFYQFWCKDINKVIPSDISNILQIYTPKALIANTPKLLAQLVVDRSGCKIGDSVTFYSNILLDAKHFHTNHGTGKDEEFDNGDYKFGIVTLEEFETQMLQLYHPFRHQSLKSSIAFKLNCGIYYKKTNQLVGWALLSEMGTINGLHVIPEHRGKNLAKALVERIVLLCEKFGIIPIGFAADSKKSYLASIGFQVYPDLEFFDVRSMME